jgi:RimJ/RimL family protein N-acetyltransferase|tara:strand:+ start:990 stop:1520 length:531 start_codon:yes stop_codon:yes gene_type:complete
MIVLETERLILRAFEEDDFDLLVELDSDPEVMRFITDGHPRSPEETEPRFKSRFLIPYENKPPGFLAAIEKISKIFIGWFQFELPPSGNEGGELGYRLKKEYWGKGYATEGSKALIQKGFDDWEVERVFARAMKANRASIRVMEKCGLTFVKNYHEPLFPGIDKEGVVYELKDIRL